MRLSAHDQLQIKSVFSKLSPFKYELKIFGSRVQDSAPGGDIDLLLIVAKEHWQAFKDLKYIFLDALYEHIGEQKIDLVIATPQMLQEDEFLRSITAVDL